MKTAPQTIERFRNGQRVVIVDPSQGLLALRGCGGTVVRLRRADDGAWVRMDAPLPDGVGLFNGDERRAHDVLLFPEECAPLRFERARCVTCGCTDDHACAGGCSWLVVDRNDGTAEGRGICSRCAPTPEEARRVFYAIGAAGGAR